MKVLKRNELKQLMGGNFAEQPVDNLSDGKCIVDGQSCGWFTDCCNACLATFKCGKPKS